MTGTRPAEILRQLECGSPDAELLRRFASTRDAAAFAELVRRHGPLVLGVCRRVTGHAQDAEDAFQATFLVLAKKAGLLRNAALLGNWLYGVAFRVASRARRSALRRRAREVTVYALPEPPAPSPAPNVPELGPILDEELSALAECYRDAIILCDLRGVSREEAAAALGIPEGTLSSRLANGRKRLAARLTKRGVALSVAALPGSLTEAAAASVPCELVTKICGLVAVWAAGGAVPGSLAQLARGGLPVRKTLMLVALLALAVGGAVLAASPNKEPPAPNDPPRPLAVAQKPDPAPQPKANPQPGDKPAVAYTSTPRLRVATDIEVGRVDIAAWSNDGQFFAVQGSVRNEKDGVRMSLLAVHKDAFHSIFNGGGANGDLVGFTPDSRELITQKREYNLVSGFHWLRFETLPEDVGKALSGGYRPTDRKVNLDLPETHGYAFAPEGKAFRTVAFHRDTTGEVKTLEALEVDLKTGKAAKSLLKVDFGQHALSANGKRLAVLDKDAAKVTVYDLDRGAKLCEHAFPADGDADLPPLRGPYLLVISPDGRRLFVCRGPGRAHLLDADSGRPLPLEVAKRTGVYPAESAFTGDGRLFASRGTTYALSVKPVGGNQPAGWTSAGSFLTVWDTQTGKPLKTWDKAPRVMFHPSKPLLAILEPNGENQTRVGFWDFSAEVAKK